MSKINLALSLPLTFVTLALSACSGTSVSQISEEQLELIEETESTVTNCEYSEEQNGWTAEAEMTNTTEEPIQSAVITIDFLDKDKKVLGFATANATGVTPGQQVEATTVLANKKTDSDDVFIPLEQDAPVTDCIVSNLTFIDLTS